MEPPRTTRRLSLDPIPLASPPRLPSAPSPKPHPHRYPSLAQDADSYDEKSIPPPTDHRKKQKQKRPVSLSRQPPRTPHSHSSPAQWTPYYSPDTARPYPSSSTGTPASSSARYSRIHHHPHTRSSSSYPRIRSSTSWTAVLRPWFPLIMYAITSLAFVVAFALYRTELFTYLDELSLWLRADEQYGHAVLFSLIFLTTIPPIPLYSTLIILSGYTFGPWTGALISYFAALSGALSVFILSRLFFRASIESWLASCTTIKRVVRAIEKRPKLLFLIRLAPYPYNVMNCLLAASPTLTLHTYTVCTALSLFKVIIHTSVGASIHSFRDYHNTAASDASPSSSSAEDESVSGADMMARLWTILGILLCVLILVYLSIVARRAVDEELDDLPVSARDVDGEETRAFLEGAESDDVDGEGDVEAEAGRDRPMSEIPFRR